MRLIKPSVEIIKQEKYDLLHVFKFIELAGRTCYKSENKITEDSASEFVNRMVKFGHGAMLEHGTIYLTIPISDISDPTIYKYILNPYSKAFIDFNKSAIQDLNKAIWYINDKIKMLENEINKTNC